MGFRSLPLRWSRRLPVGSALRQRWMAQPLMVQPLLLRQRSLRSARLGSALVGSALALVGAALSLPPARALETVELQLPLLNTTFTVKLSELADPQQLMRGNSDLAELDQATDGKLGRQLQQLFDSPLPVQTALLVEKSAGTPLLEQALLAASSLGHIHGLPNGTLNGEELAAALQKAASGGRLTILSLLQALPGKSATVDLQNALTDLQRVVQQQKRAGGIATAQPAATVDPALAAPGPLTPQRQELEFPVAHRPKPLQVVLIRPQSGGNGKLVLISHGLWDGPSSFEGWGNHLASHGYTVLLPRHPGSDKEQQRLMLSGDTPPPSPSELRLRPLDLTATLNQVAAGGVAGVDPASAAKVVVMGHSWGATTALQLGGARPSATRLRERCQNVNDPDRNISWVLQCSFISTADQADLSDGRVRAIVAVSPPLNLLFDHGAAAPMQARGLLITGSQDWVVTPDPEAIARFGTASRHGHQLVVAKGGDHFNLRGPVVTAGGPLRALLLTWVQTAYGAGDQLSPGLQAKPLLVPVGWGDPAIPLVLAPADTLGHQPTAP